MDDDCSGEETEVLIRLEGDDNVAVEVLIVMRVDDRSELLSAELPSLLEVEEKVVELDALLIVETDEAEDEVDSIITVEDGSRLDEKLKDTVDEEIEMVLDVSEDVDAASEAAVGLESF